MSEPAKLLVKIWGLSISAEGIGAITTVSIFMMLAEPKLSSQALICPSIALALASMKILTFIGLGILLTRPLPVKGPNSI